MRIAVLISGSGTNLQALIDACADPAFGAEIGLVISNEPEAPGLARADRAGIHRCVINHRDYADRDSFERALTSRLKEDGCELVCLAGFMRILTAGFVGEWRDRLINIHPSLLPAFKGLDTHARALAAGVRLTGCTVHYVRADVDQGPIIIQAAVAVLPGDTVESLGARVLEAEHQCYPLAVRLIAAGKVRVDGDRAVIDGAAAPDAPLLNPAAG